MAGEFRFHDHAGFRYDRYHQKREYRNNLGWAIKRSRIEVPRRGTAWRWDVYDPSGRFVDTLPYFSAAVDVALTGVVVGVR